MIRKRGRPVAALVPVEDLTLLREIEDRIDLEDVRKALAEARGKFIPWETVKRELGLSLGRLLARRRREPAHDPAPADPLAEASPVLAGLVGARRRAPL